MFNLLMKSFVFIFLNIKYCSFFIISIVNISIIYIIILLSLKYRAIINLSKKKYVYVYILFNLVSCIYNVIYLKIINLINYILWQYKIVKILFLSKNKINELKLNYKIINFCNLLFFLNFPIKNFNHNLINLTKILFKR